MKYCPKCGNELSEGVSFCANCGNPTSNTNDVNQNNYQNVNQTETGMV